jgi:G:T/U-mismatch repair DNA glycosylase
MANIKRQHLATTSKYFNGTSKFFDPHAPTKGSLSALIGEAPHTLLLGTQASDNAIDMAWAFATNENAFWHIMGDALGFRRGFHVKRSEAVDSIRRHLLHGPETAVDYEEAVARLTEAGFAVWDIVAESERGGSLDQDIRKPRFHDIRQLLADHPTIRRICFATGQGSAKIFRGAWKEWLATPGAFQPAPDRTSREVFERFVCASAHSTDEAIPVPSACFRAVSTQPVELVVMESVSPAAVPSTATYSVAKRAAAYAAEGRHDLAAAGCPRAAAYAWKRARWLTIFEEHLHPRARATLPFGRRPSDFECDDARETTVDIEISPRLRLRLVEVESQAGGTQVERASIKRAARKRLAPQPPLQKAQPKGKAVDTAAAAARPQKCRRRKPKDGDDDDEEEEEEDDNDEEDEEESWSEGSCSDDDDDDESQSDDEDGDDGALG